MIPKASIIICVYNKPELIKKCVRSILRQKISEPFEILLVDGGSDKKTLNLLEKFVVGNNNIRIINNPQRLPEGEGKGKWLGFRKARGEIVGVIDQDNELLGIDCLKNLLGPFKKDEEIFGVACRLFPDKRDSLTNQCIALIGTDPFLAYRSLDGVDIEKVKDDENKDYYVVKLKKDNVLVTGGNCFFYRKKFLDEAGGYIQDIDNLVALVEKGHNKFAVPKNAFTHHFAIKGFRDFLLKKKKWASEYSPVKRKFSWMPSTKLERKEFIKNLWSIFTIFPLIFEAGYRTLKTKDLRWLFVPVLKIATALVYITQKRYL